MEKSNNIPGGAVELEGKEDVIRVAYLTNETSLCAQVAVQHVIRGLLHQGGQEVSILAICYLKHRANTRLQVCWSYRWVEKH